MEHRRKLRILMDLEKLNTLSGEGCPACSRKFTLGEEVVLARGKWEGLKYIHEDEAFFDKKTNEYYDRRYYLNRRRRDFS
jgi:hypothetical protein